MLIRIRISIFLAPVYVQNFIPAVLFLKSIYFSFKIVIWLRLKCPDASSGLPIKSNILLSLFTVINYRKITTM